MNAIKEKISRQSEMVWWMVNTKLVDMAWNDPIASTLDYQKFANSLLIGC